jgi:hypothetical protein
VTQILLPVIIGFLLFGILLYWFLQGDASGKSRLDFSGAHNALSSLQMRFLPVDLVDRILNYQDMVFVQAQGDPGLMNLLNAERRGVAIFWLRRTREQVRLLMSFHVRSARRDAKLGLALEIKLALHYFVFLMAYNALFALIRLRGPFHARRVAGFITAAVAQFCAISQQALTIADAGHVRIPEVPGNESPAGG